MKDLYKLTNDTEWSSYIWIKKKNLSFGGSVLHVLSHFSHVRLFVILWTVAQQDPLFMGFSRQEFWSGLPCPPPRDLPNPWIKPASPALLADSLHLAPPGKPENRISTGKKKNHSWTITSHHTKKSILNGSKT